MRFVSLDLETTGLDPTTDTIIEVAAIAFSLERDEGGSFRISSSDERTMLVNPGRKLKEEITMITGISEDMLEGKPRWEDIRERVEDFTHDAVIVGHNVLFDIGMLETHGIDLTGHIVLDTFELSEIFSQEAESLNLGFLGGLYGLCVGEVEHRALGDTRVSMALFVKYLNDAATLTETKKSILRLMSRKEQEKSIALFCEIAGISAGEIFVSHYEIVVGTEQGTQESFHEKQEFAFSFDGDPEVEVDFILSQVHEHERIAILTSGKKVQSFLTKTLIERSCNAVMSIDPSRWCSLEEIQSMIENVSIWERKMSIFMGKLLFWLEETRAGLLEELSFYGEEREYLRFFRTGENEYHHFRIAYNEQLQDAPCIVYDSNEFLRNPTKEFVRSILIKDIPLLEDIVRRTLSIHINVENIIKDLRTFPETAGLIDTLYLIGDIYENIPCRPKGDNPFPPGGFGETYFFNQEKLWNSSGKWLVLFTRLLASHYEEWKQTRQVKSRRDMIQVDVVDQSITALIRYGVYKQENIGTIIHIRESETIITFIPRDVSNYIQHTFSILNTQNIVGYGYNLMGIFMQRFLRLECGIQSIPQECKRQKGKRCHLSIGSMEKEIPLGTVILTTSQKHIREIGKNLQRKDAVILMQGISGGKGKILSLFEKNKEKTILIGLIGTWKDEFPLWRAAKNIIIAKLPFDPPSDPYFLARTVGISDNFSLYSEPMMIIRINTLVGRIRSAGYIGDISCMDERLVKTIWGKEIAGEIL